MDLFLLIAIVTCILIKDVAGDELCYNINEEEWHSCASGCCGHGAEVQCCLSNWIIGVIIIGTVLSVVVAVIAGFYICKKKTMYRRMVNPDCHSRNGSNCNVSVIQNSNPQWPYVSRAAQPPPYTMAPPPAYSQQNTVDYNQHWNQQQLQPNNTDNQSSNTSTLQNRETPERTQSDQHHQQQQHQYQQQQQQQQQQQEYQQNITLYQSLSRQVPHPPVYSRTDPPQSHASARTTDQPPHYTVYADRALRPSAPPL